MKLVVLGGGDSPEREVSLRSAAAVADAARGCGYDVISLDPSDGLGPLDNMTDIIVLPILHGKNGEDGVIQAELEKRGLAFLGSDSVVSARCFDKWRTREQLEAAGIQVAKGALVNKDTYQKNPIAAGPHVLKILRGGSSIGTLIVRNPSSRRQNEVHEIFAMEDQAVLEELIEGTEITVPILDGSALPVIEIRPPKDKEFDYENKYNGVTAEICPPKNVSESMQTKARKVAERTHKAMDCRHLSRVDIMIDEKNNLYVLEINTMPGLTGQSLYPKSAAVAGLPMPELIRNFVGLIGRDYNL